MCQLSFQNPLHLSLAVSKNLLSCGGSLPPRHTHDETTLFTRRKTLHLGNSHIFIERHCCRRALQGNATLRASDGQGDQRHVWEPSAKAEKLLRQQPLGTPSADGALLREPGVASRRLVKTRPMWSSGTAYQQSRPIDSPYAHV